jgi:hypothetical protein
VVDDEPSPSEQIAFAAELLGIDPPPKFHDEAKQLLSPSLELYEGCIPPAMTSSSPCSA